MSQPRKRIESLWHIVKYTALAFLTIIIAIVVDAYLAELPYQAHRFRSRAAARACGQIKSGVELARVFDEVETRAEPIDQSAENGRLVFYWDEETCVVEFDPQTQVVSRAYSQQNQVRLIE